MTNQETAQHFREYAQSSLDARWSWPTEGCGYRQHMKFMEYRDQNWHGGSKEELKQFLLGYADYLEHTPSITPIDKPGTSAEERVEKLLKGDEYRRIIATGYNVPHCDVIEALVVTINEVKMLLVWMSKKAYVVTCAGVVLKRNHWNTIGWVRVGSITIVACSSNAMLMNCAAFSMQLNVERQNGNETKKES